VSDPERILVEVAGFGPDMLGIDVFEGPTFHSHGDGVRWKERSRVVVPASPDMTLAEAVDMAAAQFGVRVKRSALIVGRNSVCDRISGVAFYSPDDDQPGASPYPWASYFVVLDEAGVASWGQAHEVTVGGLVRAAIQGLYRGDPTRIYFRLTVPQGGEVLLGNWDTIAAALEILWHVIETAASVYGVTEFGAKISRRLRHRDLVRTQGAALRDRGAGPWQLQEILTYQRLTTEQASQLLAMSADETVGLLEALGYDLHHDEGVWIAGDGVDANFIGQAVEILEQELLEVKELALQSFLEARVEETFSAGAVTSPPHWRAAWWTAVHGEFSPTDDPTTRIEETPGVGEEDSIDHTITYEVVSVPADGILDLEAFRRDLNELGARGFDLTATLMSQPVVGEGARHILIFKLDSWAGG
jgi:hypothetical protein